MRPLDTGRAVIVAVLLGSNFLAIHAGLEQFPPLLLTSMRFLFAAVPVIFFVRPPAAPAATVIGYGITIGVIQFGLAFTAIGMGLPGGLVSLVVQAQVFMTVALFAAVYGERPRPLQVVGCAVGIAGLVVIAWWRMQGAATVPFLMVLSAAAAWAFGNLLAKTAPAVNKLAFVAWSSLAAPLPLFALSWLLEDHGAILAAISHPTWTSVGSIFFNAYLSTILAFATWNALLTRYSAAAVTPFALLVPIVGLLSMHAVYGEPIGLAEVIGGTLVLTGILLNSLATRPSRAACPVKE